MGKKLTVLFLSSLMVMLATCSKDKVKTAAEYWDLGRESFNNRKYAESIDYYQKLVKRFPEDTLAIRAFFSVAEIYKNNLKDYQKSIETYKQIITQYPDDPKTPNASFMIGYIYANDLKDLEKARTSYEEFMKNYPDHMLVSSAKWEIENLGKSLDEIPQLQKITKGKE